MKRKRFFAFTITIVGMVIALGVGWSNAQVFKWDIPFYSPRGTKDFKVFEKWCVDLKAASGGRLDLRPLGGGEVMPVIETFIETIDPNGPLGAKGIGEFAMVPTAPAIVNAIYDAVGVRIKDLPASSEKVFMSLKEKGFEWD